MQRENQQHNAPEGLAGCGNNTESMGEATPYTNPNYGIMLCYIRVFWKPPFKSKAAGWRENLSWVSVSAERCDPIRSIEMLPDSNICRCVATCNNKNNVQRVGIRCFSGSNKTFLWASIGVNHIVTVDPNSLYMLPSCSWNVILLSKYFASSPNWFACSVCKNFHPDNWTLVKNMYFVVAGRNWAFEWLLSLSKSDTGWIPRWLMTSDLFPHQRSI